MEQVDCFVKLVCGSEHNDEIEIDKILKHLSSSLKIVVLELVALQSLPEDKISLYGPYLGRSMLELSMTALIGRLDPFKTLLMKKKQEQHDYDLGKPHSSSIRWQGDIVDKAITNLWDEKALKDPTRAILGAYQIELILIDSAQKIIDEGSEELMGEWFTQMSNTDPKGVVESIKSKINTAYSSLSKGVHHELLVPLDSILDRDTVLSILNDTLYIIASLSLLLSQVPYVYKSEELGLCFSNYKSSKELEFI